MSRRLGSRLSMTGYLKVENGGKKTSRYEPKESGDAILVEEVPVGWVSGAEASIWRAEYGGSRPGRGRKTHKSPALQFFESLMSVGTFSDVGDSSGKLQKFQHCAEPVSLSVELGFVHSVSSASSTRGCSSAASSRKNGGLFRLCKLCRSRRIV